MNPSTPIPDIATFYIEEIGALLFGVVFMFLYRQSRAVYFGLWAAAWGLRFLAAGFSYELLRTTDTRWLAPYSIFEFAFVIILVSAARAGFASDMKEWRKILRLIGVMPIFVALVYAIGRFERLEAYHTSHAMVLGFVYFYNFLRLRNRKGVGSRFFRFSLLVLAVAFVIHAGLFLVIYNRGNAPSWASYLYGETLYDFVLHCALAFSAMAMWSESQIDRIKELGAELDHVRREARQTMDLDRLTGLLNQAALSTRVDSGIVFEGVVAVCDMDNFKDVNDRYGHLVGDEILRNIGNLLQSSIRHEDVAFRWGGDEFVILFQNQRGDIASNRMSEIALRLKEFRVRGFGVLPITFSWGTAEGHGRNLRDVLDEADRKMYELKRARSGESASRERPPVRETLTPRTEPH
ncbi:MAG TPA: GGDEF domain-containing protein [Bryobacteraceae bacterium]|nr:GGDEF domain-containing protein [Bryobacteraceae bacterium]